MNDKVARTRRQVRLLAAAEEVIEAADRSRPQQPKITQAPNHLPHPELFTEDKLIRELDRVREMMLLVPNNGDVHATHFALQIAIDAIWNLRENRRYCLQLRYDMQQTFARKGRSLGNHDTNGGKRARPAITTHNAQKTARMKKVSA